ncbi:MAG: serine/threonine protein kinase, partial [Pyrinomonadaceae bacterium]|nr:serine/threonine protein kinase [Pyrinomonadaceae bacterium]
MNAENHLEFKNFLRWILDAEPSQRQKLLEDAEVSDEIRAEVASLIALEDEIGDFLSLPITDFSKDFISDLVEAETSLNGIKIGNYEIISELGTGGMGAVYLAKRADGKFEQKVALKMLRREFNIEKIRRYFKRESEIQAKLEHPNIARLLDVGTTADGVPFFAMEFVEGESVDKFCEKNDLSIKERLKLFNKICEAVGHAHRNLIIHRDLKPSNIIVNQKGEPKLLDFGISKLLAENDAKEKTLLTELGAMTPEYASPEQIKGEKISTATDIYSLGVILYKMLTGKFPYNLEGKINGEIFKTIAETEPIMPSENSEKNPKLKGDLDNIILKSLRKEPERRYKTVEEFSADIWRHLDGLPVTARPATFSYRASKFFQRNKLVVVATSLILLSLIGGTIASLWQARNARAAQLQAENNFAIAKTEEEKSKKISRFMFKVFSYANPAWYAEGYKSGGQARVLDALNDLASKIETEFPDELDIQAELHHQFAEVFGRVSSYNSEPAKQSEMKEKSTFHICRGLELRRQFYNDWHELVAKDLYFGAGCISKTEGESAVVWNK